MIKRSENINLNYAAKCVQCSSISPIKGADRVVAARFGAVTCVVDKSWRQGDQAVFFPPESVICDKILHGLSLYADSSLNLDPNQKGYFNERGRVKALRLRDIMSEGFVLRIDQIRSIYPNFVFEQDELFDMVGDEKIVWKYVVPKKEPVVREQVSQRWWKKSMKRLKRFSRIIPGQFAFHYDTGQLRDYLHKFTPDTQITVTTKCHGTSVLLANNLVKRELSLWEKIKKFFGKDVHEIQCGLVYSTRRVPQNEYINPNKKTFYKEDVHGFVARDFGPYVPEHNTIYGEIVGYVEGTNKYIQKDHDYGCEVGEWKFMPYRITHTTEEGEIFEWPVTDVIRWTNELKKTLPDNLKNRLMPMELIYEGRAGCMYKDVPEDEDWAINWKTAMENDRKLIGMELREPMCKNKVPREGVVIRADEVLKHAVKLKSKAHYKIEEMLLDSGEEDIES